MASREENAKLWEVGCQGDNARNDFLIPNIARILEKIKPSNILDIGTGTGYVPRKIDPMLSYRPSWTLVDIDSDRLEILRNVDTGNMKIEILNTDIFCYNFEKLFDAVTLTYTILEIEDIDGLINKQSSLISEEGTLIISIPDSWVDVVAGENLNLSLIRGFLQGRVSVPKVDKFTNQSYPFRAIRTEYLISRVLTAGFELVELAESGDDCARVYLLTFRRRGAKP